MQNIRIPGCGLSYSKVARLIFPKKQGGCVWTNSEGSLLCATPNSHAEIIWKMFVDTVQTTELLEQSSATAQGLTLHVCA